MHKKKQIAVRMLAISLLIGLIFTFSHVTDFTVAWISNETNPIANTFTFGNIDIELTETDTNDGDGNDKTNSYWMDLIRRNISKDPKVTVLESSEDCWLFVKLEKSSNFNTFIEYTIADGWTELDNYEDIYFRQVTDISENITYSVFESDSVSVINSEEVTHLTLNQLDEETYPTLSITAYAIQLEGFTTEKIAWAEIQLSEN